MRAEIKGIIEGVVKERLNDVRILDVQVEEDTDWEGDAIYRVMVVFDSATGRLDADKTAGLVRHTRSRLSETGSFKFPIFRFISQSDAKRLRAAAA